MIDEETLTEACRRSRRLLELDGELNSLRTAETILRQRSLSQHWTTTVIEFSAVKAQLSQKYIPRLIEIIEDQIRDTESMARELLPCPECSAHQAFVNPGSEDA